MFVICVQARLTSAANPASVPLLAWRSLYRLCWTRGWKPPHAGTDTGTGTRGRTGTGPGSPSTTPPRAEVPSKGTSSSTIRIRNRICNRRCRRTRGRPSPCRRRSRRACTPARIPGIRGRSSRISRSSGRGAATAATELRGSTCAGPPGRFVYFYFAFLFPIVIIPVWAIGLTARVFCSQGERPPARSSKTSPTSSDEMAHQMATPTIHEGIAQAMSLGGIARPMQVDRPKRVLLVDDDRLVRMVLAALLRR